MSKDQAKMVASMKGEDQFEMAIVFSGPGSDQPGFGKADFKDAENIGMKWDRVGYNTLIPATSEAAEPFIAYAKAHGLNIIQL
jgi:hypothetical protein